MKKRLINIFKSKDYKPVVKYKKLDIHTGMSIVIYTCEVVV